MASLAASMAVFWYRLFWRECGTYGLTVDQKIDVFVRLSKLSLKCAYWTADEHTVIEDGKTLSELFPELIPANLCKKHMHLNKLTGLLVYAMHTEIADEIFSLAREGKLTEEQVRKLAI